MEAQFQELKLEKRIIKKQRKSPRGVNDELGRWKRERLPPPGVNHSLDLNSEIDSKLSISQDSLWDPVSIGFDIETFWID